MTSTKLAVITSGNGKTEIALVSTGTLKSRLGKMSKDAIATALSLAYYTCVDGNTSPLTTSLSNIQSLLHPVYRQYICAKFNPETQTWEYNKTKSIKLLKTLGLDFKAATFESFVTAIESLETTKQAKVDKLEADKAALSPAETKDKCKEKVSKYLLKHLENGDLTSLELKTIIATLGNVQAKVDNKSIQSVTAS